MTALVSATPGASAEVIGDGSGTAPSYPKSAPLTRCASDQTALVVERHSVEPPQLAQHVTYAIVLDEAAVEGLGVARGLGVRRAVAVALIGVEVVVEAHLLVEAPPQQRRPRRR